MTKNSKTFQKINYAICMLYLFFAFCTFGFYFVDNILSRLARRPDRVFSWGMRVMARGLFLFGQIKIKVIGRENIPKKGNFVFVSNHQSLLDPPAVSLAINRHFVFVLDEDLVRIPIFGHYCLRANYLPISRKSSLAALKNLRRIINEVNRG